MSRDETEGAAPEPAWAFSYIRLSSKRQANVEDRAAKDPDRKPERDGYRRQVQLREDYLADNPHLTLNTSFDLNDIGVSGFTGANAAVDSKLDIFQRAIADGRVPRGSYLLVESLDRFSRDEVDIAQHMLLSLMRAGIIVVSLTDKRVYRSGLSGAEQQASFIFSVMTLMRAHEESRIKSERLQATWAQKRAVVASRKLTGRTPGWLRKVGNEFVEIEKRVEVVRRIMRLLADGFGRDHIARALNADPDPEKRPWGHGTQWHGGTVQKITDNRALIGEFQPHKLHFDRVDGVRKAQRVPIGDPIPDYFPRVIDDDLWNAARAVADKKRMGRAANAGGRQGTVISNLFGMVATCGSCGKTMTYRDRGPRSTPVLRCTGERAGTCGNAYRFPYHDNENAILSWLVRLDLSGGARGEIARLDGELRAKTAKAAELKTVDPGGTHAPAGVRGLPGSGGVHPPVRPAARERADQEGRRIPGGGTHQGVGEGQKEQEAARDPDHPGDRQDHPGQHRQPDGLRLHLPEEDEERGRGDADHVERVLRGIQG